MVKVKSIILSSKHDTKNRNTMAKVAHKESNAYKEMVNYGEIEVWLNKFDSGWRLLGRCLKFLFRIYIYF